MRGGGIGSGVSIKKLLTLGSIYDKGRERPPASCLGIGEGHEEQEKRVLIGGGLLGKKLEGCKRKNRPRFGHACIMDLVLRVEESVTEREGEKMRHEKVKRVRSSKTTVHLSRSSKK